MKTILTFVLSLIVTMSIAQQTTNQLFNQLTLFKIERADGTVQSNVLESTINWIQAIPTNTPDLLRDFNGDGMYQEIDYHLYKTSSINPTFFPTSIPDCYENKSFIGSYDCFFLEFDMYQNIMGQSYTYKNINGVSTVYSATIYQIYPADRYYWVNTNILE